MNKQSSNALGPQQLQSQLADGAELALLDVRDEGTFSAGHIFFAASMPLNRMEYMADKMVPRRNVRTVLVDDGDGLAQRAAERLASWGYTAIRMLDGGMPSWRAAGLQVFSGVYVPSKAFGEFVEHAYATPHVTAATLQTWRREGKDMLVLDSRPYDEFHRLSLPGGINCPGAELVHRAFDLASSDATTIVVNCAGRTRGIIGAQALINAGIPNPVVTVENGLAGWYLHGGRLAEDRTEVTPPPTPVALQKAVAAAQRIAQRFGVREIGLAELEAWQACTDRSVYLLDVRTPEEYQAGHLPHSRCAPGGQLVQSTDHFVGVRGACLVLVDDNNGVRARVTASWLLQMGWKDVYVLRNALHAQGIALLRGPEPVRLLGSEHLAGVRWINVIELRSLLERKEALVVDLDTSLAYRRGHIPGSWFAVRSRLQHSLRKLPPHRLLVLTSPDGTFAAMASVDAQAASLAPVRVLQGGTAAWQAAGQALSSGFENMADENTDVWYSPYEHDEREAAMKDYLQWEVDLLGQTCIEPGVDFSCGNVLSIPQRRDIAVRGLMSSVRERLAAQGLSRETLADLGRELEAFVTNYDDLFSEASFPPPGPQDPGGISYIVHTDPQTQITLYFNAIAEGMKTPPHNHMTWAVIAAQEGEELNRIYRRVDDGSNSDRAELVMKSEFSVKRNAGIQFLPLDIHSIHVQGERGARHFHLYGKPLDQLEERLGFNLQTGDIMSFNANHLPVPKRAADEAV